MRMTLAEAFDMIDRSESPEQYERRIKRIRRLTNERVALLDTIDVMKDDTEPRYVQKREKAKRRLKKVLAELDRLQ